MSIIKVEKKRAQARGLRVRNKLKKVAGDGAFRISVFRSNKYTYVQLIDDKKGLTMASASSILAKSDDNEGIQKAKEVGRSLAEKIKAAVINGSFYFDRGCYLYHGRVKAVAEGLREGGIEF